MKRISVILIALVCALAAFGQTTSTTAGASTPTTGSTATNRSSDGGSPFELVRRLRCGTQSLQQNLRHAGLRAVCSRGRLLDLVLRDHHDGIRRHLRNGKAGSRLQNENVGRRQRDAHRDCGWKPDDDHAANSVIPTSINLGGVGGGFAVKVDPGLLPFLKSIKGKGVSVLGEVRIAAVSSQGVQPQIAFSLNYRFK
jgi:hypothetical protein